MEEHEEENYEDHDEENIEDDYDEINNNNYKNKNNNNSTKQDDKEKMTPNIQIKPPGTKQKRRSKNETSGRDFTCGCGKTYLSYPALYTHIKTKHNGKTPEGTNANQLQDGRGRGRPRKNLLINEDSSCNNNDYLEDKQSEIKDFYKRFTNDTEKYDENKEENFIATYKSLGLLGGPSDPKDGFPNFETSSDYLRKCYEPIYNKIIYQSQNNIKLTNNSEHINYDKEHLLHTCDDLFAGFLLENSKIVCQSFYKLILIFIRFYRECMNILGWECLKNYKDFDDENTSVEYCQTKNGDHLPEIANDFLDYFLPLKCDSFDKDLAIILVNHFCSWLYKNRFSNVRLTAIGNI